MSTKYAKARDAAGQWRQEFNKMRAENLSLRRVIGAARLLLAALDEAPITPSIHHAMTIQNLKKELADVVLYDVQEIVR